MILAHLVVGVLPVEDHGFSWYWLIGSLVPDIDHIAVLIQHRIFSWNSILDAMRNEEKYNLRFKTKYMHSIFGALVSSTLVSFFSFSGGLYFFLAYLIHLLLDWPDKDVKQYLYPLKTEFKGFLPIFSLPEQVFTVGLIILAIFLR